MANPTIEELQNREQFEQIAQLNHSEIKQFVMQQLSGGGTIVLLFMVYQVVMILIGLFFFTRSAVQLFQHTPMPFYYSLAALFFCVTLLIVIHELLHGAALKIVGAKQVNFGGYLKKFIFYAEADRMVLNRGQFAFIALTPLVAIKIATLTGALFFLHSPQLYFFIFVMSAHSLFCAGDIGLLSVFYQHAKKEIFTYDIKEEKRSFYFLKK